MKKLLIAFGVLALTPSLGHARSKYYGKFITYGTHSTVTARPTGTSRAAGAPRAVRGGSGLKGFAGSSAFRSAGAPQPTEVYPGIPAVEGALIRDPSMFVKQQPTGEAQRWHSVDAGGVMVASDEGKAQSVGGAGAFMGKADNPTGSGTGASGSGGYGTFFQNTGTSK